MFATRDLKKGDEIFLATPNYICRCLMCLEEAESIRRELKEEAKKLRAELEDARNSKSSGPLTRDSKNSSQEQNRKDDSRRLPAGTQAPVTQASRGHLIWTTTLTPHNFNDEYDGSSEQPDEPDKINDNKGIPGINVIDDVSSDESRLSTIPEESGEDRDEDGDGHVNMDSGEDDSNDAGKRPDTLRNQLRRRDSGSRVDALQPPPRLFEEPFEPLRSEEDFLEFFEQLDHWGKSVSQQLDYWKNGRQ
ncbi:hypothetical protein CGMCC3_g866 [Colletotrichum fructicola]|uniref:Uncharacterized protein n=1 Tax=Colletotrichum fructicola (strain Nara gc5) TaxID=1213859 RepID=A0A7J6IP21_COLFN|nr:uncharacterized protein CGMCC3_g866 [Colletotrichum fructicola]KAE9582908.1 hypothetical protein CGMCC3_g866 [Colletotrichum fructicola]KAF4478483.1 hypothetical protein CGGC5_v013625 [Colletotrichum fructicola Nara gc5]KAF5493379.1 hypothetical protein CGCF413_v009875 [Colletotrichum fructicola]